MTETYRAPRRRLAVALALGMLLSGVAAAEVPYHSIAVLPVVNATPSKRMIAWSLCWQYLIQERIRGLPGLRVASLQDEPDYIDAFLAGKLDPSVVATRNEIAAKLKADILIAVTMTKPAPDWELTAEVLVPASGPKPIATLPPATGKLPTALVDSVVTGALRAALAVDTVQLARANPEPTESDLQKFAATYWLWPFERPADAKRGQLANAVEAWQKAASTSQIALVYRMFAVTSVAAGQTDAAAKMVKAWVAKHATDPVANAVAGDFYAAIGKDTDALDYLKKAANQSKGSLATVDALARCLRRLGRIDEALDQYAVASRMWSNVLPFYLLRGDMAMETQQFEVARAAYRAAMLQAPAETAAVLGMGRALLGLERWEEAWAAAGQLLAATPADPAAQALYGEAGLRAGKLDEVKDVVAKLAAAQPQDAAAQRMLGLVAFGLGDYDGADKALTAALALAPKDAECWRRLADARSLTGKFDEAAAALTEGLKSVADVDRAPLYLDLAAANLYRQKYDEALAAEAEAEKVLPNSAEPLYLKALVLLYKGAPEELLKAYAAALEKDPKAAGQGQQVIADLERIVEQDAKFDDARLAVAVLYEASGRTRDARKRYREYLAAQPTSPVGEQVKARVAALEAGGAG